MPPLEALTREATALAAGASRLSDDEGEVSRVMQICNACRYCEGFCAVFPAMTRRLEFGKADVNYLPISATTAAVAFTHASMRRRTSSPWTCRVRWRKFA